MNLYSDIFVCVAERDTSDVFNNSGSIVLETYTANSSYDAQLERASCLENYGKVMVAKLLPISIVERGFETRVDNELKVLTSKLDSSNKLLSEIHALLSVSLDEVQNVNIRQAIQHWLLKASGSNQLTQIKTQF